MYLDGFSLKKAIRRVTRAPQKIAKQVISVPRAVTRQIVGVPKRIVAHGARIAQVVGKPVSTIARAPVVRMIAPLTPAGRIVAPPARRTKTSPSTPDMRIATVDQMQETPPSMRSGVSPYRGLPPRESGGGMPYGYGEEDEYGAPTEQKKEPLAAGLSGKGPIGWLIVAGFVGLLIYTNKQQKKH